MENLATLDEIGSRVPVLLLASMAAARCIFHKLATWGVETVLVKPLMGGVQYKTKTF